MEEAAEEPEGVTENVTENPPDGTENPPDGTENPPDGTENPPDDADIPPDASETTVEALENPPDAAADEDGAPEAGPELAGEVEESEGIFETSGGVRDDDEDEDARLEKAEEDQFRAGQQENEAEDPDAAVDMESRPPPMAPSPAIFNRDDSNGMMEPASLREEFLQDGIFKKEFMGADKPATPGSKQTKAPPAKSTKRQQTYPYRANMKTDKELYEALREGRESNGFIYGQATPPKHQYCGFIYSSLSERPIGGFTNYFLPVYSQPPPKHHVHITGLAIPDDVIHTKKTSQQSVLPLSTVKITWASNRTRTRYRPESIYAYLTRFGPIDAVYVKSVNSVYVIFCDLEAARTVVACSQLGRPWDPLIAFWLEPRMYNSVFYYKYACIENPPQRFRI